VSQTETSDGDFMVLVWSVSHQILVNEVKELEIVQVLLQFLLWNTHASLGQYVCNLHSVMLNWLDLKVLDEGLIVLWFFCMNLFYGHGW